MSNHSLKLKNILNKHGKLIAIVVLIALTFIGVYVRLTDLTTFSSLVSDEGIYAQDSYVLSLGYVPYKDVFLAQPPVFFAIEATFLKFFGSSLFVYRLPNVILSIITIPLIAFFMLKLQKPKANPSFHRYIFPLLGAGFYAIYPPIIYWSKIGIVDPMTGFFLLLGTLMLVVWAHNSYSGKMWLMGGAFFMSVAALTKYSALFFAVPFLLMLLAIVLKKRGLSYAGKIVVSFLVPFLTPLLVFSAYMWATGSLLDFIRITVSFQLNFAAASSINSRLAILTDFVSEFFLVIAFAVFGAFAYFKEIKARQEKVVLIISLLVAILIAFFLYADPQVQLLLAFIPLITFVSWDGLSAFFSGEAISINKPFSTKLGVDFTVLLLSMLILLTFLFPAQFQLDNQISHIYNWPRAVTVDSQLQVAQIIDNNTLPTDKIFTTCAEYAFLAGRQIVTPLGNVLKNQGFYVDMIGLGLNGNALKAPVVVVLPEDYLAAFEKEKPEIFLKTDGVYASPDDYLWSGYYFNGTWQPGLSSFVLENYVLLSVVKSGSTSVEIYRLAQVNEKPFSITFQSSSGLQNVKLSTSGCIGNVTLSSVSNMGGYSVNMTYFFNDTSLSPLNFSRIDVNLNSPINLNNTKLMQLLVYGDNSGNVLWVTLDSQKGSSGIPIGPINWQGWKIISVDPHDVVDKPSVDLTNITGIGIAVDYSASLSGAIALDSIIIPATN
jgi:hypothetical protein